MLWPPGLSHLRSETVFVFRVLRHPNAPRRARIIALGAIAYCISPVQLIPSFIPIIGWLDDILVLNIAAALLRRLTPALLLAECQRPDDKRAAPAGGT